MERKYCFISTVRAMLLFPKSNKRLMQSSFKDMRKGPYNLNCIVSYEGEQPLYLRTVLGLKRKEYTAEEMRKELELKGWNKE